MGEALSKAWKIDREHSWRFIGQRGLKSILAMFDANAASDIVAKAAAITLRQEVMKQYNFRTNRRNEAKTSAEALVGSLAKLLGCSAVDTINLRVSLNGLLQDLAAEQAADDVTVKEA